MGFASKLNAAQHNYPASLAPGGMATQPGAYPPQGAHGQPPYSAPPYSNPAYASPYSNPQSAPYLTPYPQPPYSPTPPSNYPGSPHPNNPGSPYPNNHGHPPYAGPPNPGAPYSNNPNPNSPNPAGFTAYRPPGAPGAPGAPAASPLAGPQMFQMLKKSLQDTIAEKRLDYFYPPNQPQKLDRVVARAAASVDALCQAWRLPLEIGSDLAKLGLYNVWLYVDDSGSMEFEEGGERIVDLKAVLQRVSYAARLFDEDGISVRFMNSTPPLHLVENIKEEQQVDQLMQNIRFKGLTPLGTEMKNKILNDVVSKARSGQLDRPTLIVTLTDGVPAGEARETINNTIKWAYEEVKQSACGPGTIAYQFAQLGNDEKAREYLSKLDDDKDIGHLIDCTSNYENEQMEMSQLNPPVDLTPELWLMKLLLGAIDHSYDRKDEKGSGAHMPPGMGGAPQYGAPQGKPPGQPPYQQQPPYGQPGQPPYGQSGQAPYGGPQPYGPPGQFGRPGQPGQPGQLPYPPAGQIPSTGQYPPQQQYGAPPQQQYGAPPTGQYPPQQQHGAPPAGGYRPQ